MYAFYFTENAFSTRQQYPSNREMYPYTLFDCHGSCNEIFDAVLSFLDHGKDRQTNCPMVRLAHCRRGYKNRQGQ